MCRLSFQFNQYGRSSVERAVLLGRSSILLLQLLLLLHLARNMPNASGNISVLVHHVPTRTFRFGVWPWKEQELCAKHIWLHGLLIILAFAIIVRYSKTYHFLKSTQKYEGRVLTAEDELRIRQLLAQHGEQDSLGYFATRRDKMVIFAPDTKAAITYRILGGISLASADPIGSEASWPAAIHEWLKEARENGLIPAVLAAGERGVRYYQQHGLKALELGDEAVIDVQEFSAPSRQRTPLLKAARRLQLAGYKAQVRRQKDIPTTELYSLTLRAAQWREKHKERGGFSMALSRLGEPADDRCVLVEAFDPAGMLQGLLSLVPWGRHGLSLDFMCANRSGQSGLSEFMIHELVAASPRLDVSRISLNFVMFRSVFEQASRVGAGAFILGYRACLRLLSRTVQLESLYRFTVKSDPRWHPRFSCFPHVHQVPRITWMSLTAEGYLLYWRQIPLPHSEGDTASFVDTVQEISKQPPSIKKRISGRKVHRADRSRREKLNKYGEGGNEPYMMSFVTDSELAAVRKQFCELPSNTRSGQSCRVAGRVVAKREMGKVCFLVLSDFNGNIQAILDAQVLGRCHLREIVRQIDLGDMLGVKGEILKSQRGELSVLVCEWVLTAKCLHPFPLERARESGESRLERPSYLELITCKESREMVLLEYRVRSALQKCLIQRNFQEVETPIGLVHRFRQENTHRFLSSNITSPYIYMQNASGLYLKSLCVAGMGRIFEFSRGVCSKAEQTPDQEVTSLELYQVYTDYLGAIDLARELIQQATRTALGREIVEGHKCESVVKIDISGQWNVIPVHAAVAAALHSPITIETEHDELVRACTCAGVAIPTDASSEQLVMCAFEQLVVTTTVQPTFYIDYPLSSSPFTRQTRHDSRLAERWGLFAFGVEIATGSSELTDPIERQRRSTLQLFDAATAVDSNAVELEEELLLALEYGMPPTASLKMRLDRVLVILNENEQMLNSSRFPA